MNEVTLKKAEAHHLYVAFANPDFPKPFAYEALRNAISLRAIVTERDEIFKGLLATFGTEKEKTYQHFEATNPHFEGVKEKLKAWGEETITIKLLQIKESDLEKLEGLAFSQSLILAVFDFFVEKKAERKTDMKVTENKLNKNAGSKKTS